jgi:hypothetical protein
LINLIASVSCCAVFNFSVDVNVDLNVDSKVSGGNCTGKGTIEIQNRIAFEVAAEIEEFRF